MKSSNDKIDTIMADLNSLSLAQLSEVHTAMQRAANSLQPILLDYARQQESVRELSRSIQAGLGPYVSGLSSFREASTSLSQMHQQLIAIQEVARLIESPLAFNRQVMEAMRAAASTISFYQFDSMIKGMQVAFRGLDISQLAENLRSVSTEIFESFKPSSSHYDSWRESLNDLVNGAKDVTHLLPVRERFLSGELLRQLSAVTVTEAANDRDDLVEEADDHFLVTLPDALRKLDPALYQLWEGAWSALHSANPDRIRHTLTSARELITHVLHKLSPDDQLADWDVQRQYYDRGRPTRKGRLMFIYSRIQSPELERFIESEVEASLKLVDLFQIGTHAIEAPFSEKQLEAILRKVHSMICALTEIRKNPRD